MLRGRSSGDLDLGAYCVSGKLIGTSVSINGSNKSLTVVEGNKVTLALGSGKRNKLAILFDKELNYGVNSRETLRTFFAKCISKGKEDEGVVIADNVGLFTKNELGGEGAIAIVALACVTVSIVECIDAFRSCIADEIYRLRGAFSLNGNGKLSFLLNVEVRIIEGNGYFLSTLGGCDVLREGKGKLVVGVGLVKRRIGVLCNGLNATEVYLFTNKIVGLYRAAVYGK
jgi:hypothetical protein